jgi:hypothetical protein
MHDSTSVVEEAVPLAGRPRVAAFYSAVTGAILLLAAPMAPFLVIPVAWPVLGQQLGVHQIHDIGVAALLWLMLIGLIVQYREPRAQVAAMQQTLLVIVVLLVATAIARPATLVSPLLLPFALAVLAAALHPGRAEIIRLGPYVDVPLCALAAAAAGSALVYSLGQLRLDSSVLPIMAHGGHWTSMGSLAMAVLVLAFLSSMRPRGWKVPFWCAASAALLLGVASFFLPHQASSVGRGWSVLTVAWALAFVVTGSTRFRRPARDSSLPR